MNNAPRKRLGAYTVPMLKRFGLLAVPTVVLALLGGSIVLAQQSGPSDVTSVAPQATPIMDGPGNVQTPTPVPPTTNGQPPVSPTATPTPNVTAPPIPSEPPVSIGTSYLTANIPANLQVVRELPQPPSAPLSVSAMTIGDGTLRAVPEQPGVPSLFIIPMVGQDGQRATELPQPPSASVPLNAASPNLLPVR